ncbi:MAG: hypothetical protein PHR35_17280, partial [Kiritimatiellae bacterium]|nr:hypothetical protein [Kiritimatiellia bacterium]
ALAADWQRHFASLAWLRVLRALDGWRGVAGLTAVLLGLLATPLALGAGGRGRGCPLTVALWLGCGGALAMAGSVAGMLLLQQRFGTLYLLAGVAGGSYLCGLAAGNLIMARALSAWRRKTGSPLPRWLPLAVVATHVVWLWALSALAVSLDIPWLCAAGMWLAGLPAGIYVPVAAGWMAPAETPSALMARVLRADNWGGAAGGLLWVMVLQPVLGTALAVGALAAGAVAVALLGLPSARPMRVYAGLLAAVGIAATAWLWHGVRMEAPSPPGRHEPSPRAVATGFQEVTAPAGDSPLRRQIESGRLSNREAEYWEPVEP